MIPILSEPPPWPAEPAMRLLRGSTGLGKAFAGGHSTLAETRVSVASRESTTSMPLITFPKTVK